MTSFCPQHNKFFRFLSGFRQRRVSVVRVWIFGKIPPSCCCLSCCYMLCYVPLCLFTNVCLYVIVSKLRQSNSPSPQLWLLWHLWVSVTFICIWFTLYLQSRAGFLSLSTLTQTYSCGSLSCGRFFLGLWLKHTFILQQGKSRNNGENFNTAGSREQKRRCWETLIWHLLFSES